MQAAGQNLLFDAGRAVMMRLTSVGVIVPMLNTVFLTHLHADHITDFNDQITTKWVGAVEAVPLPVVGPEGTRRMVGGAPQMRGPDIEYRMVRHPTSFTSRSSR